jgi:DNA-nicking Smr family endonuclease
MTRSLGEDERALWARVTATVRPLHPPPSPPAEAMCPVPPSPPAQADRRTAGPRKAQPQPQPPKRGAAATNAAETLDRGWDRAIAGGRLVPDATIDLHGHSQDEARHLLHRRLLEAEARGARVVLVITGKGAMPGPSPADLMPGLGVHAEKGAMRGAIRTRLPHWLGEAHLTGRIAAVRRAHPRHGGAGAVYVILKRKR